MNSLPTTFRKLIVKTLAPIFKDAIDMVTQNLVRPHSNEVLIRNRYVGINASDINVAVGRYSDNSSKPPFEIGFEGMGEIVDVGDSVSDLKCGQAVMYMKLGSFSEYTYVSEKEVLPLPSIKPELLPLLVSGTTAALSLDKSGQIFPGEKVLITAAAGGAGHLAVQWAKNAGCHVIGTCSSDEKVKFLQDLGCDRPINYKKENIKDVLLKEYPDGVNVVWESIGGDMFDLLFKNLAIKGRLIVIGAISTYKKDTFGKDITTGLAIKLLTQSSTVSGFFLPHYHNDIPHYLSMLVGQFYEQRLKPQVDNGGSLGKPFHALEDIPKAVDYLYSGKSKGKIIVSL